MTPRRDTHAHFRSLPIFAGCTEEELAEIDRLADEVHVEAGRTIIRQGDLGQEFAVIVEGEADVVKDGEVVATLGPARTSVRWHCSTRWPGRPRWWPEPTWCSR